MEKYDWKSDIFLRTKLCDTASAPKIPEKKFDKQFVVVLKMKHGSPIRKSVPEWAREIAIKAYEGLPDVEMVCVI